MEQVSPEWILMLRRLNSHCKREPTFKCVPNVHGVGWCAQLHRG
jgi:hypothetical protein